MPSLPNAAKSNRHPLIVHTLQSTPLLCSQTWPYSFCRCEQFQGRAGHQDLDPSKETRWTARLGERRNENGWCLFKKTSGNGQSRAPLILQNIKTDAPVAIYVGMVNLRCKINLLEARGVSPSEGRRKKKGCFYTFGGLKG